jgi:hypothetical protein
LSFEHILDSGPQSEKARTRGTQRGEARFRDPVQPARVAAALGTRGFQPSGNRTSRFQPVHRSIQSPSSDRSPDGGSQPHPQIGDGGILAFLQQSEEDELLEFGESVAHEVSIVGIEG